MLTAIPPPPAADHIRRSFKAGNVQAGACVKRLTDLETSLGQELVEEMTIDSQARGGEQYRPQADKVSCE